MAVAPVERARSVVAKLGWASSSLRDAEKRGNHRDRARFPPRDHPRHHPADPALLAEAVSAARALIQGHSAATTIGAVPRCTNDKQELHAGENISDGKADRGRAVGTDGWERKRRAAP